jgi:hypothetical protein
MLAVRAVAALTVEQSMTSEPALNAPERAATTCKTSPSAATHMTMASHCEASAAGVAAAWQPSSAASACAFGAVRFHTACRNPAR